jgi:Bacterial nucleoid DNA-binding protein
MRISAHAQQRMIERNIGLATLNAVLADGKVMGRGPIRECPSGTVRLPGSGGSGNQYGGHCVRKQIANQSPKEDVMKKGELIKVAHQRVATQNGMAFDGASKVINEFLGLIQEQLQKGEKVVITGFGTFEVKDRAAKMGRNPRTGEAIQIPATKAVAFKPGKELKGSVK